MSTAVAHTRSDFFTLEGIFKIYKKNALKAMAISTGIFFSIIASYYITQWIQEEEEPMYTVRIMKYSDLGPPPSISNTEAAPQVSVSAPVARPSIGIPVPVPDAEVSPEQTFATQDELASAPSPVLGDDGTGTGNVQVDITEDIKIEEEVEPEDFVAFEKEPVPISRAEPKYPEIALKAGMEGTVYVKVWVDKEGKPKKVTVLKSDAEIFNDAAIAAAWQWAFTPAMMNNGPVAVNVTIPFKFKLK